MSIRDLQINQQPLEVQQLHAHFKIIEQKLIDGTPGIVEAMIEIHKNTQMHEELVNLLDDDDIALLHKAHEKHKQFVLVNKEVKASTTNRKKLKAGDLDNL